MQKTHIRLPKKLIANQIQLYASNCIMHTILRFKHSSH